MIFSNSMRYVRQARCQAIQSNGKPCKNSVPWRGHFCGTHDKPAYRERVMQDLQGSEKIETLRLLEGVLRQEAIEQIESGGIPREDIADTTARYRRALQEAAPGDARLIARAYYRGLVWATYLTRHVQITERVREYRQYIQYTTEDLEYRLNNTRHMLDSPSWTMGLSARMLGEARRAAKLIEVILQQRERAATE